MRTRKYRIRNAQKVQIGDTLAIIPFVRRGLHIVPDPSIRSHFNMIYVTEVADGRVVGQELLYGEVIAHTRKMVFPRLHLRGYTLLMTQPEANALVRQLVNHPAAPLKPTANQHIRMEDVVRAA